jgi:hypothetical protein
MKKNNLELDFKIEEYLYNEMIKLFQRKFNVQCDEQTLKRLKETPLKSICSVTTAYGDGVIDWLERTGLFYTTAKKLFAKYNLNAEQQFIFLKKGIDEGYLECMSFNGQTLLTNDVLKYTNWELVKRFLNCNNWTFVLDVLTAKNDMELFKKVSKTERYFYGDGYTPRELAERMDLPKNMDYSREVRNNTIINIFNTLYDDACINEKWPTKIRRLVADKIADHDVDHPVMYMNQNNIISLAKSLYEWGTGFDEPTYTRVIEFYEVIRERVSKKDLTLYDYQNSTLRNMKDNFSGEVNLSQAAPYTNYVLEQFKNPPKDEYVLDEKVLKKIIKFSPEQERHIDFRR